MESSYIFALVVFLVILPILKIVQGSLICFLIVISIANSFDVDLTKTLSPDKKKSVLPAWIIGGIIIGALVAGILLFRKKYILKKRPQS